MRDRRPIEVCITVDTEFSIGGNFGNPELAPIAKPIVLGTVAGQEHGLGFMLDCLAEFDIRATFFVETLQTAYFGDEPMRGTTCSCICIRAGFITKLRPNEAGAGTPMIPAPGGAMPS